MADITCPECEVDGVKRQDALFNIVYVCPECGQQLACAVAKE